MFADAEAVGLRILASLAGSFGFISEVDKRIPAVYDSSDIKRFVGYTLKQCRLIMGSTALWRKANLHMPHSHTADFST
jgi:hypothetical protein